MAEAELPQKVVIVIASGLAIATVANVCACITAGLAASVPGWAGQRLRDADGFVSQASAHLPVIVLQASVDRMADLVLKLGSEVPGGGAVTIFPAYAQEIHDAATYWSRHEQTSHRQEAMLGIGLAGSRRWVNALTGSLPMLRG